MISLARNRRVGLATLAFMALAGQVAVTLPARAQDAEATTQELRIRQLEAEVRALQRQVFPGGDGTGSMGPTAGGAPVTATPMTDVLTRMDALEAQVARLTAQYEELGNRVRQIDTRLGGAAPAPIATPRAPTPAPAPAPIPAYVQPPAPTPLIVAPAPVASRPSTERLAAVKAIVKPQTNDPGEDEYTYGFKLWQARFYPESEQQLQLFLEKYPHHQRGSYARNLIGRAYLDEGNPREAAKWFLRNYEADQHGDRAADSMIYLTEAMVDIKDTNRACIALAEFARSYGTEATGRLKSQYEQTRSSVNCN